MALQIKSHQIESDLYRRQAVAVKTTSFPQTLPLSQSELMEQTIKDPYIFDFIRIKKDTMQRSKILKKRT
jgi:predicted nuclease of restriction endonuclease-like (RecB) superfamily